MLDVSDKGDEGIRDIIFYHFILNTEGETTMSRFVPTWEQYKKELSRISGDIRGTIIVRLLSECGIAREEMAYSLRINLERHHTRGLWIEKAKKVKKW